MAVFLLLLTLLIFQINILGAIADLVSYGKTANSGSYEYYYPQNALDDNDVPYLLQGGCYLSESQVGLNHWWKVDLEMEFEIVKIVIISAIDDVSAQYSLLDAMVLVGNNDILNRFDNAQCGGNITFEQLNNSALVEVICSPPIIGLYVFITSEVERISFCEVLVYSSSEEAAQDDLPLDPGGFWPLNSLYTIYDLSGYRNYDASSTEFLFSNTTSTNTAPNSLSFADLSPVEGMGSSILIPNRGRFGSGTSFTLMFEIRPRPNSDGDIICFGDFTISQTNSGVAVYSSEIEITNNDNVRLRGVVFNSDTWTSIAIVYNGSAGTMSLWRNGDFVHVKASGRTQIDMSWKNLMIGFAGGGASGSIRNMQIYSRALSQRELLAALTIPSEGKISQRIAASLISHMYSVGSNLFESVYSATFASERLTLTVTVRNVHDCAFSCIKQLLCNGFAFNKEQTHCVIGMEFVDEKDLVPSNDWLFYKYLQAG